MLHAILLATSILTTRHPIREPDYIAAHAHRVDSILTHSRNRLPAPIREYWRIEDRGFYLNALRNPSGIRYEYVWQEDEDFLV